MTEGILPWLLVLIGGSTVLIGWFAWRKRHRAVISPTPKGTDERDRLLRYDRREGCYTIQGRELIEVSRVVEECFPPFDPLYWSHKKGEQWDISPEILREMWAAKSARSLGLAKQLHRQIKRTLLGEPVETMYLFRYDGVHVHEKEVINLADTLALLNTLWEHPLFAQCTVYRTDWRIYDEQAGLVALIDCLLKTLTGDLLLIDWKCSEKMGEESSEGFIPRTTGKFQGFGAAEGLSDTAYHRTLLQLNLTQQILSQCYDLHVSDMYAVVLHPIYSAAHVVPIPQVPERTALLYHGD